MPGIRVQFDDVVATVFEGEWSSSDRDLVKILRQYTETGLPPAYFSDPDWDVANLAAIQFGGTVLTPQPKPDAPTKDEILS